MTQSGHMALVDRLRAQPTETEWSEFKHNHCGPQQIGEYLSALANAACLEGGGIKRMFETQRKRSFPLPDYDLSEAGRVAVSICGRILDERYTRLLMERTDLGLAQVMLLDRIQKRQAISREEHRDLKRAGLVEGRYPNLLVASEVARAAGEPGRHIRERGFDKQYYLDLIEALVREHGPVSRRDVNEVLLPKLPDRLSEEQKEIRIHNLMQELRRTGRIVNQGSRSRSRWVTVDSSDDLTKETDAGSNDS